MLMEHRTPYSRQNKN